MQNRGVIRLFAIVLALVCLYQLSFTIVSYTVKQKAEKYAMSDTGVIDMDKYYYYLDSMANEDVYNLWVIKYNFREVQQRELNLGLDLKGGMNVILEVSVEDIIKSLANNPKDSVFKATLDLAHEKEKNSQEDYLVLFHQAFNEVAPDGKLAQFFFGNPTLKGRIDFNSTNEEVLDVLITESKSAIDNAFNVLRNRIDRFGVAQPNIQRLETSGRIMIELPGVKNPERVKELLQTTAQLEFWETYTNQEAYKFLLEANERLREINEKKEDSLALAKMDKEDSFVPTDSTDESLLDDENLTEELDTATDETTLLEELESDTGDMDTTMQRDQIYKQYPLFQLLNPRQTRNDELLPGPVIGIAQKRDINEINKILETEEIRSAFPRDMKFFWSAKPLTIDDDESDIYQLYAIKVTTRTGEAPLDGEVITDARREFGQNQATAQVTMSMNSKGSKIWARLTRQNKGGFIAIVLDDRVYSAPRVQSEITGGTSQITGDFSVQEAQDLANVLKSGKLPAPANIIQDTIVGPSLGQQAISSGLNSFLIAILVVLIYMVFYYSRKAGLVADVALLANMFFLIGVLASLGAVLTLPGIAGIVLTIGMSVDANVLIYDRIREELLAGKGVKLAVKDGYKNALSAIVDANVTTLLTAVILYIFGKGPIRGFATTLSIGILTSLFSAIFITRLIFLYMLERNKEVTFSTKLTKGAFQNTNIKFIDLRKITYTISLILVGISIFSLATRGLNQGVDFTGGRTFVIKFDSVVNTHEVEDMLKDEFGHRPDVIMFGQSDQVRITTKYKIDERGKEVDEEVERKLYAGLLPLLGDDVDFDTFINKYRQRSQKVGPTIADDIKKQAVWAIGFSLLFMFIYILFRFRKWQYGMGALGALVHDTLIVLGIFSLLQGVMPFSLEIDQAFIAAILTVVGYSINDTVVVFDRVREFLKLYPKRDVKEVYNKSLNSTLSRTFSTSISTFVVLLVIFLFGAQVIRGFVFGLMIGVIVGTYSSLFIATPIAYNTIKPKKKQLKK
jgi:SecD/SecF fusion protein